jgi:hypothetical protein
MTSLITKILPKSVDNTYRGVKVALYFFFVITVVTLIRSMIHIFAPDGGAGSIAGIPIDNFSKDARQTVISIFALWGLSQLLMGLLYLLTCIKYKSLIPLMYILIFAEYTGRFLIGHTKPILTLHTAPGEIGNYILIPLSLIMLGLSVYWKSDIADSKIYSS